jgi:hypothetical protein
MRTQLKVRLVRSYCAGKLPKWFVSLMFFAFRLKGL